MQKLHLHVNGEAVAIDIEATTLLVDLLRGPLALTGTHSGCDTAQCGARLLTHDLIRDDVARRGSLCG